VVLLLALAGLCGWSAWPPAAPATDATASAEEPPVGDEPVPFDHFDRGPLPANHTDPLTVALLGKDVNVGSGPAPAVSPDGQWLAGAAGQTVYLWRAGQTEGPARLPDHPGPVRALAFSSDSKILVVGGSYQEGAAGWLQVWRFKSEEVVPGKSLRELPAVRALAFVPGGDLLAVGGAPAVRVHPDGKKEKLPELHRLQLRRVTRDTCEHVVNLDEGAQTVEALAVAPDGRTLAALAGDGTIQVWNLAREPAPLGLRWGMMGMLLLASVAVLAWPRLTAKGRFRPAGWLGLGLVVIGLVLCGALWLGYVLGESRYRLAIEAGPPPCRSVAFSADGRVLAVGGESRVRLWRRESSELREIEPITGHTGSVKGLAFAPTGPWLASLDEQGGFKVTHLHSRQCLRNIQVRECHGAGLIVSPDGRHAVTTSGNGCLVVLRWWDRDGLDRVLLQATATLARNPKDPAALQQRAQVYMRRGRLQPALADLNVAVFEAPSKENYWLRALTHARLGNRPAALADLDHVIARDKNDALAHYQQGLLLMQNKDYRAARRSLDRAFEIRPELASSLAASEKENKP
jgi:WD40 repeat protein